jgi:hypothetical protein
MKGSSATAPEPLVICQPNVNSGRAVATRDGATYASTGRSDPPAHQAYRIGAEVRLEIVWTLCLILRQRPPDASDGRVQARVAATVAGAGTWGR